MITKDATHNRMEEVSHEQLQNKILNDIREKGGKVEHGDVVHSLAKSIPSKKEFRFNNPNAARRWHHQREKR